MSRLSRLNKAATEWCDKHPLWAALIFLSIPAIWFCFASDKTQHMMLGVGAFVLYRGLAGALKRRKRSSS